MTGSFSPEAFEHAARVVQEVTLPTNLIESPFFSKQSDNNIFLKPENLQRTGAYKVRGAYHKLSLLSDTELAQGLICASAGNHAQGVAFAAAQRGVTATVVMPITTPYIKIQRTRALGAEVVLFGDVYDDAHAHALELAAQRGATFIHPFNDLDIACGQSTVAQEIIAELPEVDTIVVPIGGGGLACGTAVYIKQNHPHVSVVGVEPRGAASYTQALKEGEPVRLHEVSTIADGTAVRQIGDKVFPYLQKYLDDVIEIDDEELIGTFLDVVEAHKMIVEASGLLAVSALSHLSDTNKNIVAVMSGGNMDVLTLSSVVQMGLIQRDRIFTVALQLPDRPGTLTQVTSAIASARGNIIKLEHNQFVSANRSAAIEISCTIEAFGTAHKEEIITALKQAGFKPEVAQTSL